MAPWCWYAWGWTSVGMGAAPAPLVWPLRRSCSRALM